LAVVSGQLAEIRGVARPHKVLIRKLGKQESFQAGEETIFNREIDHPDPPQDGFPYINFRLRELWLRITRNRTSFHRAEKRFNPRTGGLERTGPHQTAPKRTKKLNFESCRVAGRRG